MLYTLGRLGHKYCSPHRTIYMTRDADGQIEAVRQKMKQTDAAVSKSQAGRTGLFRETLRWNSEIEQFDEDPKQNVHLLVGLVCVYRF